MGGGGSCKNLKYALYIHMKPKLVTPPINETYKIALLSTFMEFKHLNI